MTDIYFDNLSRKRIAKVALSAVDKNGLAALTTRRVAHEIGVTSPALYHHFHSKADLLDEVVKLALHEVQEPDRNQPWTAQVIETSASFRRALMAHPNLAPAMTLRWRRFGSPFFARTARAMAEARVPPKLIPVILNSIEMFTYGAALEAISTGENQQMYGDLSDLEMFPEVAATLTREASYSAAFEPGLKALIAGWDSRLSEM